MVGLLLAEKVPRDGTVTAVVSRGPERHDVPALRGKSLDAAQSALLDAGLSFGDATYRYSAKVLRGAVLAADPAPGTRLRRGVAVDLVVSRGPRPVRVPDLVEEDAEAATKTLEKAGFEVDASEENSDSVPAGKVISQVPRTGSLHKGDTVRLSVSKGPVLVDVPDVRRMNVEEATDTLTAAGFSVRTERVELYVGIGLVVKQSPAAEGRAPRGSTVTIFLV